MGLFSYFANERKKDDIAAISTRIRERIAQMKVASADIAISRIDESEWGELVNQKDMNRTS